MNSSQLALQKLNVLVTRPEGQQQELRDAIAVLGGQSVGFPLLCIEPVQDQAKLDQLRRQVLNLDQYQLLVFISTNAARYGAELIDSCWPQFPVGVDVLAVGPTTAEAVQESLHCEVISSSNGMASEDLLALPELTDVDGKKIALFRGVGGRELLANTLRDRGAMIDYFEVYHRDPVEHAEGSLVNEIEAGGVNVITAFSGDTLRRLLALLPEAGRDKILAMPLLVPSQRVADFATAQGFTCVYNAEGANVDASIRTLQEIAAGADN